MDNGTWEQTLQALITTESYDNWMRTILFSAVIAGFLTIIGVISLMKKLEVESFSQIYTWLVIFGSALVFAEREIQPVMENQEIISKIGINLWRLSWITLIILLMWFARNLYCSVWSEKAYHWQLLLISLLLVFQPTFFDKAEAQIYAKPIQRLCTVVNYLLLPRWDRLIKEQINLIVAEKASIANMSIVMLYIGIWISFVILLYKTMKKFEFKKTNNKVVDTLIKYGILIPLYYCPVQTFIVIGIMPFTVVKEKKEKEKKPCIAGTFRHW